MIVCRRGGNDDARRHTIKRRRSAGVGRKRTEVVPCDCDDAAAGRARPAGATIPARGATRARGPGSASPGRGLDRLPGFCSAQEIHAELRRNGEHIGLTTVYRHLQALSEQGDRRDRDDSGEILYRQCETSVHHHHLTCRTCGRSVEVEGRAVEQWAERVAAEAGFTDVGHMVELFGRCPQCAR